MSTTLIIDSLSDPAPFTLYPGLEPAPTPPALFTFPITGQQVRAVQGPDGEPWFVARDVCAALDTDQKDVPMILDQDEHCTVYTIEGRNNSSGLRKDTRLVSEPGLYSLILRSRKPQARAFKRWITHEVLPALRRSGHYSMPSSTSSTAPAIDADLARRMLDRLTIIEQQLAPLKEKASRFDAFLAVDGTASLTEAAKMLGMTAISLAKLLRSDGLRWLFKKNGNGGPNIPTAEVIRNGWMVLKAARSPFDGRLHSSARFTAKGLDALYGIIEEMKESLTPVNKAIYEA